MKILYIPLDERPCNYKYPQYLAMISNDIMIVTPPKELLGWLKRPANTTSLWNWVFDNIKDCSHAIISIDTLLYGNIINSRIHNISLEECNNKLMNLLKLKELNPSIEIHAFNLVTRISNGNSDAEDPSYWKEYGQSIWKYCCLTDKTCRGIVSENEKAELCHLNETIPEAYLDDFLNRRKTNSFINLKCIDFIKDGVIDYLVIPKDDCSEYGFAAMEQNIIAKKIYENRVMHRVMVYPGADEVGSILFSRVFNKIHNYCPKIYVRYSSTLGPSIIPKYEDRPLQESIKSQITSLGGVMVNNENDADFLLAVHCPGKKMIESLDQRSRDISDRSHSNIDEFVNYIKSFYDYHEKLFAIADVAFANGADDAFMVYANKLGILEKACAYGGWNTAQNTIGVVLAQASLCSYFQKLNTSLYNSDASENFLVRKIIEDWIMQTKTLYDLVQMSKEMTSHNLYSVKEHEEEVKNLILNFILTYTQSEFNGRFNGKKITVSNITLPWDRVFEIDFDLKLEKN